MKGTKRFFLTKISYVQNSKKEVVGKAVWSTSHEQIAALTKHDAEVICREYKKNRDVRVVKIDHIVH